MREQWMPGPFSDVSNGPGYEANVCQRQWINITWVCAYLGFIAHTLCHYFEMVLLQATRSPSIWRWPEELQSDKSQHLKCI